MDHNPQEKLTAIGALAALLTALGPELGPIVAEYVIVFVGAFFGSFLAVSMNAEATTWGAWVRCWLVAFIAAMLFAPALGVSIVYVAPSAMSLPLDKALMVAAGGMAASWRLIAAKLPDLYDWAFKRLPWSGGK